MAAALGPPTKRANPTYEICPMPITYEMPNAHYEIAHPTYIRKVPIRPTKNAHPINEKCPSDLQKVPILTCIIEWPSGSYNIIISTSYMRYRHDKLY